MAGFGHNSTLYYVLFYMISAAGDTGVRRIHPSVF
jgi:hypothetical protein